jgi:hypothetical protein
MCTIVAEAHEDGESVLDDGGDLFRPTATATASDQTSSR